MFIVKGRYGTRHPKDVAARERRELGEKIKNDGCTKSEIHNATEQNVQKCMREMKAHWGDKWKKQSKFLGEDTNPNKMRRR